MPITFVDTLSVEDYNALRASAGWPLIIPEQALAGLKGSAYLVAARDNDKTVGMARLVSDDGFIAYVADVIVFPEYQRMGIGTDMMNRLIEHVKARMKSGYQIHLVLISSKGKEDFYQKFGFVKRPDDHFGFGMTQWLIK